MKVADIIGDRREVFTVTDTTTVHDAARFLREKQIRACGVYNAQGQLCGCISQSDISDKVAAENRCPAWMHVKEIMSTDPVTVALDASLDECLRLMDEHGFYHLCIVDPRGAYRGMISVQDLLKVIASDEKARADLLESYIYPPH